MQSDIHNGKTDKSKLKYGSKINLSFFEKLKVCIQFLTNHRRFELLICIPLGSPVEPDVKI